MARLKARANKPVSFRLVTIKRDKGDVTLMTDVFQHLQAASLEDVCHVGRTILDTVIPTIHNLMHDRGSLIDTLGVFTQANLASMCEHHGSQEYCRHGSWQNRTSSSHLSENISRAINGEYDLRNDEEVLLAFVETMLAYQFVRVVVGSVNSPTAVVRRNLHGANDTVISELLHRGLYEDRKYMAKLITALRESHLQEWTTSESRTALSNETLLKAAKDVCFARGWPALVEGM